jgi:Flp pilus assembly protein TadG
MFVQTKQSCPEVGHPGRYRKASLSKRARPPIGTSESPRVRSAAALVEFALVCPIVFLCIFAIIEFGRTFMVMEMLADAARVACRIGIVPGTSTQQIKDSAVGYLATVGVSGDAVNVSINDGVGNVTEAQSVPSYTEITVQVSVGVSNISWLSLFLDSQKKLSGQWTMRRE